MSQICIVSKQLALIFKASYNSPKTLSVKVLTLPVAAKPTLPAIKHLQHVTVTKSARAYSKSLHNMTALKNDFVKCKRVVFVQTIHCQ